MDISRVCFPLTIDQRASFVQSIQLLYQDNSPVVITGYKAKMQIRQTYEDTDVLVELTTENGGITITGATGTIDLYIPAAITKELNAPMDAVYDLLLLAPYGPSGPTGPYDRLIDRLIQGGVLISPGTTNLA